MSDFLRDLTPVPKRADVRNIATPRRINALQQAVISLHQRVSAGSVAGADARRGKVSRRPRFQVWFHTAAQRLYIGEGSVAAGSTCPTDVITKPITPTLNDVSLDENPYWESSELSTGEDINIICIFDDKAARLVLQKGTEEIEKEDCERAWMIATISFKAGGAGMQIDHFQQRWSSDIPGFAKGKPAVDGEGGKWCTKGCDSDDSDEDSDGSTGGGDNSDSESSDSNSDSGSAGDPDSGSDAEPAICPCPPLDIQVYIAGIGEDLDTCFNGGLVEDVRMLVVVKFSPIGINCPNTFGDLLRLNLVLWFTNANQQWADSPVLNRYERTLWYNTVTPQQELHARCTIKASCGQWRTLKAQIIQTARIGTVAKYNICDYPLIHTKMPGLRMVGEWCSYCTNEDDSLHG